MFSLIPTGKQLEEDVDRVAKAILHSRHVEALMDKLVDKLADRLREVLVEFYDEE